MEIIDAAEAFIQQDGDLVYDNTKIILRRIKDNRYFYTRTLKRILSPSTADLKDLRLIEIPTDRVWPKFHTTFTKAPQPLSSNIYVKRPSLIDYGDTPASCRLSDQVLNEVKICEILRHHPHPNIAQYLGCIVEHDQITGICFIKYDMNLSEAVRSGITFDRENCLKGIESGISHLHQLGLIHNDLNPTNIMMKDGVPVIIDFDSCREEGEELGLKGGTVGWSAEGMEYAIRNNDNYGISKIHDFLIREAIS